MKLSFVGSIALLIILASCQCLAFTHSQCDYRITNLRRQAASSPKPSCFHKEIATLSRRRHANSLTKSQLANVPISDAITSLGRSLFRYTGPVPLWQASSLNAVLFFLLRKKLATMLTKQGFIHSFILGSLLWTTLGWRGWTLCVLYLFLGSLITKVGFEKKEKLGIAESRGGRRGPENVW